MACRFCREDDEREKCSMCGVEVCHACWVAAFKEETGEWNGRCEGCDKRMNDKSKVEVKKTNGLRGVGDAKLLDMMRSKTSSVSDRLDASDELTRRMKNREARKEKKIQKQGNSWTT